MYTFEKRISQTDHDGMVSNTAVHLKNNNYVNVKADVTSFFSPDKIINHRPDLSASKGLYEYIFEVETSDTINIDHTRKQWKEFGNYAALSSYRKFVVIVPSKKYEKEAQMVLNELSVNADIWYFE